MLVSVSPSMWVRILAKHVSKGLGKYVTEGPRKYSYVSKGMASILVEVVASMWERVLVKHVSEGRGKHVSEAIVVASMSECLGNHMSGGRGKHVSESW